MIINTESVGEKTLKTVTHKESESQENGNMKHIISVAMLSLCPSFQ